MKDSGLFGAFAVPRVGKAMVWRCFVTQRVSRIVVHQIFILGPLWDHHRHLVTSHVLCRMQEEIRFHTWDVNSSLPTRPGQLNSYAP